MKVKRSSLRVEGLETRDTPAVTVSVVAGDLFVYGDATSDSVQLSRQANGLVRIQGLSGTAVNGFSFVDRYFNDDLFINLGAGTGYLVVLDVNGGITADDVDIKTGNNADLIDIRRLNVLDDIFLDTNDGNDIVYLNHLTVSNRDNPANNVGDDGLNIYTRGGKDSVSIYNSFSAEDVVVILDPSTSSAAGFDDALYMDGVRASDDFFLYGFAGNDRMYLNNLIAGDVFSVSLGAGNDLLKLTNSQANSATSLGETGTDTLHYYNNSFIPWTITGFESYVNGP